MTNTNYPVNKSEAAPGVALALAEDVRLLSVVKAMSDTPGKAARMDELRERIQGHWDWLYDWMCK